MLVRVTEAFVSYLTFSKTETPVILRMTNGHPYGRISLLRGGRDVKDRFREDQDPPDEPFPINVPQRTSNHFCRETIVSITHHLTKRELFGIVYNV